MLVSVVATDRSDVEAMAHAVRDQSWISIRLGKKGVDYAAIDLSISVDVARALAPMLVDTVRIAEQLVAKPAEVSSNA